MTKKGDILRAARNMQALMRTFPRNGNDTEMLYRLTMYIEAEDAALREIQGRPIPERR